MGGGEIASRAHHRFDHYWLAECSRELVAEQPRGKVGWASCGGDSDDADGFLRIVLCRTWLCEADEDSKRCEDRRKCPAYVHRSPPPRVARIISGPPAI